MTKQKYGIMPPQPRTAMACKVKGDAGVYAVTALDWKNHRVGVSRAGEDEWVPVSKITFIDESHDFDTLT